MHDESKPIHSITSKEKTPNPKDYTFHFTVDVDYVHGAEAGLIKLYDFCEEYKLQPTFFFTGMYAVDYSELVAEAVHRGFEIGTHGWKHDGEEDYRTAPYSAQKSWVQQATAAIEKASGCTPTCFRAPNLWISEMTLQILAEEGYQIDSSVPAGRFDFGMGQVSSMKYTFAPLAPYHPNKNNLAQRGSSQILEIPPSAFFIPLNMSGIRNLGLLPCKMAVNLVKAVSPVLTFYSHPAEFVAPDVVQLSSSVPKRHRTRIGPEYFEILADFIDYVHKKKFVSKKMLED